VRLGFTDKLDSCDLTCIVEFPVSNLRPNADYLNKIFLILSKSLQEHIGRVYWKSHDHLMTKLSNCSERYHSAMPFYKN